MARAVINMERGLIQPIMADQEGFAVMVPDFDTEGGDDKRSGNSRETRFMSSTGWTKWTRSGSMKSKWSSFNKTLTPCKIYHYVLH
jgi:hypothetical protein